MRFLKSEIKKSRLYVPCLKNVLNSLIGTGTVTLWVFSLNATDMSSKEEAFSFSSSSINYKISLGPSFISKKRPVTDLEERIARVTQAEPDTLHQVRWRLTSLLEPLIKPDALLRGRWNSLWKVTIKEPELLFEEDNLEKDILWPWRKHHKYYQAKEKSGLFILETQHSFFVLLNQTINSIEDFETLLQENPQAKILPEKIYKKAISYLHELVQFYKDYRDHFIDKLKENCFEADIYRFLEPKAMLITQGSRIYRVSQETARKLLCKNKRGDSWQEEVSLNSPYLPSSSSTQTSSEVKSKSNHHVSLLSSMNNPSLKVYFKNTPGEGGTPVNPFKEFMLQSLYDALDIEVPETEIVFLNHVKFNHNLSSQFYALQASRGIIGITGKQLLIGEHASNFASRLDPIHYANQVLGTLLTCPSDGKPDNFIYTRLSSKRYGLVSIDNDEVFKAPIQRDCIHLKSLLLCLPLMEKTLSQEVQEKFEQLVPEFTILQWLNSWRQQYALYKSLQETISFQASLSQEEVDMAELKELFDSLSLELSDQQVLNIQASPSPVSTILERLRKLKLYLKENSSSSLEKVFAELYPAPSAYYKALRQKFDSPQRCMEAIYGGIIKSDQTDYSEIQSLLPSDHAPILNATSMSNDKEEKSLPSIADLIQDHLANIPQPPSLFAAQTFEYLQFKSQEGLPPRKILSSLVLLQKYNFIELQETKNALKLWIRYRQWAKETADVIPVWEDVWDAFFNSNPRLKWERNIEKIFYPGWHHEKRLPNNPFELKGAFMGKRSLLKEVRKRVFDAKGNFKKDLFLTGRNEVTFYPLDDPQFYFKKYPEFAGYEAACTTFLRRWGVKGIPHSDLSVFYDPSDKKPYPVLISEAVPGNLVHELWDKEKAFASLDPHHTGLLLLASILLNPEDGKEDNHILSPDRQRLIPIDNDHIFLPGVQYEEGSFWTGYKLSDRLQSKSLLFCLDEMTLPLPLSCINHLSKLLNDNNFLGKWFKELKSINKDYQSLLDERDLQELWKKRGVSLRISLPEPVVKSLYWKLELMKELLKDNSSITPLEILSRLEPYAGKKYHEVFESVPVDPTQPRNGLLKERFQSIKNLWPQNKETNTSVSLLNSRQMAEILSLPDAEIYASSNISKMNPDAALELLKELIKEREANLNSVKEITALDASILTKSQESEQLKKFLKFPQQRLSIYQSKALRLKELNKYFMSYGGILRFLDLRGAQNLKQAAFELIAQECLNLEHLNTSSWNKLKQAIVPLPTWDYRQPFSRLKRWVIKECSALQVIEGEFPALIIVEASDNSKLDNIYIKAPTLEQVDLTGLNALTQANLRIQGGPSLTLRGGVSNKEFKRLHPLALKGDKEAQNRLGIMYNEGQGVKQDDGLAFTWYQQAADQGLAVAQFNLGNLYFLGQGIGQDSKMALFWIAKAAQQGLAIAQYHLSLMYSQREGMDSNEAEAVHWLKESAEKGFTKAQYDLGFLYEVGQGVNQDFNQALNLYKRAAFQGEVEAQYRLGLMYLRDQSDKEATRRIKVLLWLEKAAEQGFAPAQCDLGFMYARGQKVKKDEAKAFYWFKKAAEQGEVEAQYQLGFMYSLAQGIQPDEAQALYWLKKAAEKGVVEAQNNLGIMYQEAQDVEQNEEQAFYWIKKAAAQGFASAQYNLGFLYYYGQRIDKDYKEALFWFTKAAEQGEAGAQYLLGDMYNYGEGVFQNQALAFSWYKKAAEQGLKQAQNNVAMMYQQGVEGIKQNDTEALHWVKKAAEQGLAGAQYNLGFMYYMGQGTVKNYKEAFYWLTKSAEQEEAEAQYYLGDMYYQGLGIQQDFAKALFWLQKSADYGYAAAQYQLGLVYEIGEEVEQDDLQAFSWYKKAAEQGMALAQNNLAMMYRQAQGGVEQDDKEALYWLKKSAEQGFAPAQYNLGLMFHKGLGTVIDHKEAFYWLIKAAEQEEVKAQYYLGETYNYGEGINQDKTQAFYWYKKAADQGYAPAQNRVGSLHLQGRGVDQDKVEGLKWLKKAAEQGLAQAQYHLSLIYDSGEKVEQNDFPGFYWLKKAADQGLPEAQNKLGWHYQISGPQQDYAQAFQWFTNAAKQGYGEAVYNLGCMYAYGLEVAKDYGQALKLYKQAAEQGLELAQYKLGALYYLGQGTNQDYVQAFNCFLQAAGQGLALAQNNVASMYDKGLGVKQDKMQALEWYKKAAEQGLAEAHYNLGALYFNGQGGVPDYSQALHWYNKASEQKDCLATYRVGYIYQYGPEEFRQEDKALLHFKMLYDLSLDKNSEIGSIPGRYRSIALLHSCSISLYRDLNKAFKCLQKSCELNDPVAFALIGRFYKEGMGTSKSLEKAFESLHIALEKNNSIGQYNLALMYRDGEGVAQNDKRASELFLSAAEQGEGNAQYSLAWMYEKGRGVEKSLEEANKWYKLAETRFPHEALYSLGRMYEYGLSVDKNLNQALKYYEQAAALGDLNAQDKLAALKEE